MFSSFTGSVYMLAFWVCLVSSETFHPVKHGSSLKIMNAADSTVSSFLLHIYNFISAKLITFQYLTSTEHAFRPDYGAYVGMVLTEGEFDGTPNQIWDTIRWPNTSGIKQKTNEERMKKINLIYILLYSESILALPKRSNTQ